MEKTPKEKILSHFKLAGKFEDFERAKEAHLKAQRSLTRVNKNIMKANDEIKKLKTQNIQKISEGDFDDKITSKIGGLRLQIDQSQSILPDLQDVVKNTKDSLDKSDATVKDSIAPEIEKVRDELRNEITALVQQALDLNASWVDAVSEIYSRAGLKLRSYEAGGLYIRDFEEKLKTQFNHRLYP